MIWIKQVLGSVPFGCLLCFYLPKITNARKAFLCGIAFAVANSTIVLLLNRVSGINYISLSTDSAIAVFLGCWLGLMVGIFGRKILTGRIKRHE